MKRILNRPLPKWGFSPEKHKQIGNKNFEKTWYSNPNW